MKKFFNKRQVAVAALVLALAGAVYVNWHFSNSDAASKITPVVGTTSSESDKQTGKNLGDASYVNATTQKSENTTQESEYFAQAKLDRQSARDASVEQLNKVINNKDAQPDAAKAAAKSLSQISENINLENKCETLIKSKDISNCLVMISDGNVQVIVKATNLSDAVLLQIKEIVMKQTGVSVENISIIQVK